MHSPWRHHPHAQAFSSYLLIAWVTTNVIFVTVIIMFCNYTWESCAITEAGANRGKGMLQRGGSKSGACGACGAHA